MRKLKVAVVRGRHLNHFELQTLEPLLQKVDFTGFASLTAIHREYPFPVHFLSSPIDVAYMLAKLGLRPRLSLGVLNRIFIDTQYLWRLEEKLLGFDIAHTADTYYHFTAQCLIAKRQGYVKKVVATVWENIPFNNEGIRGRRFLKQRAIREIDFFIATTHQAKDTLIEEGCDPRKIKVIYPGIDLTRFKPVIKKRQPEAILFVGRLVNEKGIWTIFEAFKKLHKKHPTLRLRFCGEGEEQSRLMIAIKKSNLEQAISVSPVSYDEMPQVYSEADIFVLASESTRYWKEQFGMVLVEAMASGLPVVATRSGAIPEVVEDAGLLIGEGNVDQLESALDKIIRNEKVRKEIQTKGIARSKKMFDAKKNSRHILKVYEQLLQKN